MHRRLNKVFGSFALLVALGSGACVAEERFETGLTFASEDEYEAIPKNPKFRAFLPERFELPDFFPPPGRQGLQGSCVAWAVAYGARSYYQGVAAGTKPNRSMAFSPAYVFNQTKLSANCRSGSSLVGALRLLSREGVTRLAEFPYSEERCDQLPSAEHRTSAASNTIKGFSAIRRGDIDGVKGALTRGHPVIVGMMTNHGFHRLRGPAIFSDETEATDGGHAMVIVGYDDKQGAFKLLNSWGEVWGDQGYGWVSYNTMRQRGREYYVMDVQGSPSPPKPQPLFPQRAKPTQASISEAIRPVMEQLDCGKYQWSVTSTGVVTLRGFSGTPDRFGRVQSEIKNIEGVSKVDFQIASAPWPQCEALVTLSPTALDDGSVRISMPGRNQRVIKGGEQIAFDIQLPQRAGFVYVHYLQTGGGTVPLIKGSSYQPGEVLKLGQTDQRFYVGPPFGDEMLIVITSPIPLNLSGDQDDRGYLSSVRQSLLSLSEQDRSLVRAGTFSLKTIDP